MVVRPKPVVQLVLQPMANDRYPMTLAINFETVDFYVNSRIGNLRLYSA